MSLSFFSNYCFDRVFLFCFCYNRFCGDYHRGFFFFVFLIETYYVVAWSFLSPHRHGRPLLRCRHPSSRVLLIAIYVCRAFTTSGARAPVSAKLVTSRSRNAGETPHAYTHSHTHTRLSPSSCRVTV